MTPTKPDPLSPERVEAALDRALEELEELSSERSADGYYDALNGDQREWNERLTAEYSTFAALARGHLDATKREPPAGLVEVIGRAIEYCERNLEDDVATAAELAPAIARAVVEFATSDAGISRALVAWFPDYEDDYPREGVGITAEEDDQYRGEMRAAVRAALGATEESK